MRLYPKHCDQEKKKKKTDCQWTVKIDFLKFENSLHKDEIHHFQIVKIALLNNF